MFPTRAILFIFAFIAGLACVVMMALFVVMVVTVFFISVTMVTAT